jgi:hypothetical protein
MGGSGSAQFSALPIHFFRLSLAHAFTVCDLFVEHMQAQMNTVQLHRDRLVARMSERRREWFNGLDEVGQNHVIELLLERDAVWQAKLDAVSTAYEQVVEPSEQTAEDMDRQTALLISSRQAAVNMTASLIADCAEVLALEHRWPAHAEILRIGQKLIDYAEEECCLHSDQQLGGTGASAERNCTQGIRHAECEVQRAPRPSIDACRQQLALLTCSNGGM